MDTTKKSAYTCFKQDRRFFYFILLLSDKTQKTRYSMARTLILQCSSLPFRFLSPLAKKRWFRRCSGSLGKNDFPFLFGVVEQTVEINVVHQCYPDHSSQS